MRRFLLYPLASVLMLAGEPAVGAPSDEPSRPGAEAQSFLVPLEWIVDLPLSVPAGTQRRSSASPRVRRGTHRPRSIR